tara:strand:- start:432 stop:641 length:210 start_codon:yes stop_codon:yes gene_type:complete
MKVQTTDTVTNVTTAKVPVADSFEELLLGRKIVQGEIHLGLTVEVDGEEVTQIVALSPKVVTAIKNLKI